MGTRHLNHFVRAAVPLVSVGPDHPHRRRTREEVAYPTDILGSPRRQESSDDRLDFRRRVH